MQGIASAVLEELAAERVICRRAQRMWRIVSVLAAVVLGLWIAYWAGAVAFCFFQFLAFATRWHSVNTMQARTGLTEANQALALAYFDASGRGPHT